MGFSAAINVAEAGKKWPLAVHLLAEDSPGGWYERVERYERLSKNVANVASLVEPLRFRTPTVWILRVLQNEMMDFLSSKCVFMMDVCRVLRVDAALNLGRCPMSLETRTGTLKMKKVYDEFLLRLLFVFTAP